MTQALSRAKKGAVVIQTRSGRLRLQLPRQICGGDRKYLYLNLPDTPENWELAQAKAQLIESDIKFERLALPYLPLLIL
ncbi:MAG: DUF3596 domain-containing protein [Microcoleus sp. PH2017_10_PVI_O_A]|uniref:Arm DNA-binding domain-containing protein n=1 Tax=unclassified Microcoleus TaxID=2642155 RepID=UPI001DD3EA42|nr:MULTISPECIES: DUF3596 domain-containing protein [unclassified Microcoleus]TAE79755.1 MAG: DUF3596 domain-containing protein [Oscillatoriales cyanobacterium]MCC3408065.1 DUF3596 domain-containing protein [Microcoleus sp. PH2017_10_PVI_O_A]MCC3462185.1 DUF3596 domain-containing protein [Microcoleus sp. PH2017_11_PCY_U_A]MCC3480617.1 DUF3596 domain-containing protein [Microcoleus sp. PH2017_12_PCY_D_A]MCC3530581.1 DUF3596 domain-containing protein [Microcoleus sp. PH2017_21_RUC_O_A]